MYVTMRASWLFLRAGRVASRMMPSAKTVRQEGLIRWWCVSMKPGMTIFFIRAVDDDRGIGVEVRPTETSSGLGSGHCPFEAPTFRSMPRIVAAFDQIARPLQSTKVPKRCRDPGSQAAGPGRGR